MRLQIEGQEAKIFAIAAKYGGISAGAEAGFKVRFEPAIRSMNSRCSLLWLHSFGPRLCCVQGYFLTYVIAYLRDFALNFCCESIPSSSPELLRCARLASAARLSLGVCGTGLQGSPSRLRHRRRGRRFSPCASTVSDRTLQR